MANDFFLMGYVMCLRGRSRYFRLVLACFLFCFSAYSLAVPACYSRSTIQRGSKPQNSPNALKTSCKLISYGSGYKKCNQPDGDEDLTTIESDDTGLTIHHGKSQDNFFHDGWWTWDEQFSFGSNLKAVYRNALLPSLIKALKNDNCDIANAILDAMQNPNIVKNGGSEFLGFKNGDDKCAVLPDGKTLCKGPSYRLSKTKDGETRLHVDPNNPEWNKSLDDYAGISKVRIIITRELPVIIKVMVPAFINIVEMALLLIKRVRLNMEITSPDKKAAIKRVINLVRW
ncbi:hypothetical protein [Aggregatibacter actinomycetemcomitans]|uniref:hypothetical protein n=1 Tax=Aggregatibacter actinomycetemcomitans TaxID=714 RepID=UPI0021CCDB22|nr:hypothetical protein [Aggregatibacter actinomycetemcomitans]